MPYRVTIRPTETREITAEPGDLPAFAPRIAAATPEGYELIESHPVTGTGLIRSRETHTVEIAELTVLRGAVPDGWQALNVIAI